MASLTLEVATPLGLVLSTEVDSIAAPSVEGEFGVLPDHLPLLAALQAGVLRYQKGSETHQAAVGPGFVEAAPDKVLLLTDAFATPDQVNEADARAELRAAESRLAEFERAHVGARFESLQRDIEWARARLTIVGADE